MPSSAPASPSPAPPSAPASSHPRQRRSTRRVQQRRRADHPPAGGAALNVLTDATPVTNRVAFWRLALLCGGLVLVAGLGLDPTLAAWCGGAVTCAAGAWLRSAVLERAQARRAAIRSSRCAERKRRLASFAAAHAAANAAGTASSLEPTVTAEPTPRRFNPDDPALIEHLEREGFAVVRAVAGEGEVAHARDLFWSFLERSAEMRRGDPASWTDARFRSVGDPTNGIISGNGFGQSDVCWYLRTLPRVRAAFEAIWGTRDLLVSFDGGNAFRPFRRQRSGTDPLGPPGTQPTRKTAGGWWHVDQGPTKSGLQAVQGIVSLRAATEHTGGLCVIPKSHLDHDELMSYAATNDSDYVAVPEPRINPAVRRGRLVTCEAGDMLLWDSRTIHCNTPALTPPQHKNPVTAPSQLRQSQRPTPTACGARRVTPPACCTTPTLARSSPRSRPVSGAEPLGGSGPGSAGAPALLRAVTYVCMTPRSKASYSVLRARRRAFAAGVSTSHWPHEFHPGAPPWALDGITQSDIDAAFAARFGAGTAVAGLVKALVG